MLAKFRQIKTSYFKLLLLACLGFFLVSLTLLFIPLYISFQNSIVKSVSSHSLKTLSQTSYSVEFMQESANTVAEQLFFNSTINQLLYALDYNDMDTIISLNTLNSYVKSTLFIESVYIYSSKTGNVSFSSKTNGSGFEHIDDFYDSDYLKTLKANESSRFIPFPRITSNDKLVYSFLLPSSRSSDLMFSNSIMINISAKWLENTYKSIGNQQDDMILIIDSNGVVVNQNAYAPVLADLKEDPMIVRILNERVNEGYFLSSMDGEKQLVTYTSSPETGWSFVLLTPYSTILGSFANLKTIIFAIYFSIMICGIPICLIVTKRLYVPYSVIQNKLVDLEVRYKSNHMVEKQNKLHALLVFPSPFSESQVLQLKAANQFKVRFDQPYSMLLLQIDRFADFCDQYPIRDRALITYCIQNISEEIIGKVVGAESVQIDRNGVCMLFNQTSELQTRLTPLVKEIQQTVRKDLKLSVSVCVAESGHTIADASQIYQTARESILNKFFKGPGCIVYASEETAKKRAGHSEYQPARQKQLTDLIMVGKFEAAKKLLSEMIENLKDAHYDYFSQIILTITLELNNTIQLLEKANELTLPFQFNTFIAKINNMESVEELLNLFFRLFDEMDAQLELKKKSKNEKLVQEIIGIIQRDYRDVNLSLESIADLVHLSSSHLRRLFKKETGSSIADYISRTRMEQATHLLLSTSLSIANISEQVGYVNSTYFFTLFKKAHGITPAEFRSKYATT